MNIRKFSSIITLVRRGGYNEYFYLLKKRKKEYKAMYECMECPGGELQEGETYKEAALREYLEETGIEANNLIKKFRFTRSGIYEGKETKRIIYVFENVISLGEVADINYKSSQYEEWNLYPEEQILLMNNIDSVYEYFKRKYYLDKLPRLLILEGADGSGKTTILGKIVDELEKNKIKYSHDNRIRKRIEGESMLEFRKAVVERRNENITEKYIKRIREREQIELVIIDKSPYTEYFYQQTDWNHEKLSIKENHQMEKKMFELEEVIDAAFVIHLKNKNAWKNYYDRESSIINKPFDTMSEQTYHHMKSNFEKYAPKLYKHHIFVEVENDEESWKRVWKIIKEKLLA